MMVLNIDFATNNENTDGTFLLDYIHPTLLDTVVILTNNISSVKAHVVKYNNRIIATPDWETLHFELINYI